MVDAESGDVTIVEIQQATEPAALNHLAGPPRIDTLIREQEAVV
jgi:hypothetical protein